MANEATKKTKGDEEPIQFMVPWKYKAQVQKWAIDNRLSLKELVLRGIARETGLKP